MKRVRATFTIDENILKELEEISTELNTKKSHIVETSLTTFFDFLDCRIAEKRLQELENGTSYAIKSSDVWKELGFE